MNDFFLILMESDLAPYVLLAGPAGGVAFYVFFHLYYRNSNKSHSFETETRIESRDVRKNDHRTGRRRGVRNSTIDGRNDTKHRKRANFARSWNG